MVFFQYAGRSASSNCCGYSSCFASCRIHKINGKSICVRCLHLCDSKEERIIACYYTNWAWYRSGRASFTPENINASLCTHIIYAFNILDESSYIMKSSDPWSDIDNNFFQRVTDFKKNGSKVLISVGGWTDSGNLKWRTMINNATLRANFVSAAETFIKKYNFDGCDFDYEYPACPQGNLTAVNGNDKVNFVQLIRETKAALGENYLVTCAVAGGKTLIEECYDMKELCKEVDWINIMNYEYHSFSDGETGANGPICPSGSHWGVVNTIEYYLKVLKCPAKKMVMGIPFYGMSYTLANSSKPRFGEPVTGPGNPGSYTAASGTLAFYEICLLQNSGWITGNNKVNGSYIYNEALLQFVAFDGEIDIMRKCCLLRKYDLLGAMVYALDYDDFNNMCGSGSYPLLKTVNKQLRCLNEICDN